MKRSIDFYGISFLTGCALVLMLHSCKLQSLEPVGSNVGYDFYPLEAGRYIEYEVYDTIYEGDTRTDSYYQIKEKTMYSFQEGKEKKFVVYRFVKTPDDTEWPLQPDSVITVVNTGNQLVRTENNTQYIKLVFPVEEGKRWNGNAKNQYDEVTSPDKYYKMINIDQAYTVGGSTYPQTLVMYVSNQSDPIVSTDIRYDVYARGIGCIEKDYKVYYYKQDGSQIIDYGSHKVMRMTAHGKE